MLSSVTAAARGVALVGSGGSGSVSTVCCTGGRVPLAARAAAATTLTADVLQQQQRRRRTRQQRRGASFAAFPLGYSTRAASLRTTSRTTSSSSTTSSTTSGTTSPATFTTSTFNNNKSSSNSSTSTNSNTDRLLVVGSGVAGSATALIAAQVYQIPVTILHAGRTNMDCNSYWAQGGIIYRERDHNNNNIRTTAALQAADKNDADKIEKENANANLLARDIMRAGAGLCLPKTVRKVATEGPHIVQQLLLDSSGVFANVPFDKCPETGDLSLCLEASHSAPRILHYKDATGRAITEEITRACRNHPLITLQSNTIVTDLLVQENTCIGVQTLTNRSSGSGNGGGQSEELLCEGEPNRELLMASHGIVLCAGGLAGIYQHSTNPTAGFNALGSSVALAERHGIPTRELEFVQFHPTSLNVHHECNSNTPTSSNSGSGNSGSSRFLLTEALRGEGAILRNVDGERFMPKYHDDAELAPRDIVARGVYQESKKGHVYLDITHRSASWLYDRFPTIAAHLRNCGNDKKGLDLAKDWLPIVPAAHYTCGGIATDLEGKTALPNLYAAGEAARTGLHGGNRLASTSLLEGLVFGAAVAHNVGRRHLGLDGYNNDLARGLIETAMRQSHERTSSSSTARSRTLTRDERETIHKEALELLKCVKHCMWDRVGVIRTVSGLTAGLEELQSYQDEASRLFERLPTRETAGVRDAAVAGRAVCRAALDNRNSVGAHCIVVDTVDDRDCDDDVDEEGDSEDEDNLANAS